MEWCQIENGKYRIVSLSQTTIPGALKVITESFCQDEAVCIGAEVNKNPKAAEELLELCADAALDGVSLVAIATNTGEVVAAAFNKLQVAATGSTEKPFFEIFAEERCNQDSSKSLIQFMANVDGRCSLFEKYDADCSLEIMFLATLKHHRDHGLGRVLCQKSIDLAKKLKNGPLAKITVSDLGPKYQEMQPRDVTTKYPKMCQAIWTSQYSQRIGKALKFNVELTVSYEEFIHNGKSYADRLGALATYCEVAAMKV